MIFFFFFNDTATTEIYTLSLHDALPISNMLTVDGQKMSKSSGNYVTLFDVFEKFDPLMVQIGRAHV